MNVFTIIDKISVSEKKYPFEIFNKKNSCYSFINPYGYHLLRKNKYLYDQLDGLFVDGILMCLLINFFWNLRITRRSFDMTTVAKDLFNRLVETGESVYFVGARQEEIDNTIKKIQMEFPKMHIVGYNNGYFRNEEEKALCYSKIMNLNPDFVVVGMGAILQEKFILNLHHLGYRGIAFTCGGYLRQASSGIYYFPDWAEKYHLRAIYRLYKEKGMYIRLYNVLVEFPLLFIYDYITTIFLKRK